MSACRGVLLHEATKALFGSKLEFVTTLLYPRLKESFGDRHFIKSYYNEGGYDDQDKVL